MQFTVLASGSKGNTTLIEAQGGKYLIDAGLSAKKTMQLLTQLEITIDQIKGIFVTHEHGDHVGGIRVLCDRYAVPIYIHEQTYAALKENHRPKTQERVIFIDSGVHQIGPFVVEAFPLSHDVAYMLGYTFSVNQKKLVYVTDSGYVNQNLYDKLRNADAYIFETNHDPEMVRMSGYPFSVQQRILSDVGHLSNEDSALILAKLIGTKTQRVVLAHLSQENNTPDLARLTVENIFKKLNVPNQFTMTIAKQEMSLSTYQL
ncbi:MAG: MBL fold metallo-hydrolase [Culicoidibacterales bacterium]